MSVTFICTRKQTNKNLRDSLYRDIVCIVVLWNRPAISLRCACGAQVLVLYMKLGGQSHPYCVRKDPLRSGTWSNARLTAGIHKPSLFLARSPNYSAPVSASAVQKDTLTSGLSDTNDNTMHHKIKWRVYCMWYLNCRAPQRISQKMKKCK